MLLNNKKALKKGFLLKEEVYVFFYIQTI